jgi:hypothetical protein
MKTSTEHINALNDLAEGETLELIFDPMSELGDWKDVECYPNYQINNEGAFMNKRTLKMLKHFIHKDSNRPAVTLYRNGKGDVLDVQMLLILHFGPEAVLPKVNYFTHTLTEIAPPKAKNKPHTKKPLTLYGIRSNFFCSYW